MFCRGILLQRAPTLRQTIAKAAAAASAPPLQLAKGWLTTAASPAVQRSWLPRHTAATGPLRAAHSSRLCTCGSSRLVHTTLAAPADRSKSPYLHSSPGQLPPHPLDIDQPYPAPTEDGFFTISFYSFFDIPERTVQSMRDKIQKEWVEDLGVVGRIYICEQGINAQLSIPESNTQALRSWLESSSLFSGRIPKFNWAIEHRRAFKALHVRVRPLVAAGEALDLGTLEHEPEYLKPQDWENELREAQRSQESQPLLIDMRNSYEFRIGKFEGAVCPDVDTFREEMDAVRSMCKGKGKKEPIYMYCTGGIRCSVAGAILKSEGYENVKTLQGGVIAYGRHIREQENGQESSLYHGKNFTFDKRLGEEVTSEVLAKCDQCGGPCDTFTNCANTSCNLLFIQCPDCAAKHDHTCGNELCIERAQMPHEELVKNRMAPLWNYRTRVRPEEAFDKDGIARPKRASAEC